MRSAAFETGLTPTVIQNKLQKRKWKVFVFLSRFDSRLKCLEQIISESFS